MNEKKEKSNPCKSVIVNNIVKNNKNDIFIVFFLKTNTKKRSENWKRFKIGEAKYGTPESAINKIIIK